MVIRLSNLVKTYVHTVYATIENVIFKISARGLVLSSMSQIVLHSSRMWKLWLNGRHCIHRKTLGQIEKHFGLYDKYTNYTKRKL